MTEQRLKAIETVVEIEPVLYSRFAQELIDEVCFLQAALADSRKETDMSLNDRLLKLANQPVGVCGVPITTPVFAPATQPADPLPYPGSRFMKVVGVLLVLALLPLSRLPAQHHDNCTPTRWVMLTARQYEHVVKQHLMQCAVEAPTENLTREMKNKDAFVRWAASVELNRRYYAQKAMEKLEKNSVRTPSGAAQGALLESGIERRGSPLRADVFPLLKGVPKQEK